MRELLKRAARWVGGASGHRDGAEAAAQRGFRYWAFISYSHSDEAWAKWLQRKIEAYRAPVPHGGKSSGRLLRLFPLFRDEDEAPASDDLGRTLREALKASNALIVLCSPRAAKSKWVNQEILDFRRLCPGRPVVAVILDGEPFGPDSPSASQCFPAAMRPGAGDGGADAAVSEPLAADLRKTTRRKRRHQLLKVIAAITGVELDALVRRDRRRTRKQLAATGAAFALVAAAGAGAWWFERQRTATQAEARLEQEYRTAAFEAREQLRANRPWAALDLLLAKIPADGIPARIRQRIPTFDAAIRMAVLGSRVDAAWPMRREQRDLVHPAVSGLLPHPGGRLVLALENDTVAGGRRARLELREIESGRTVARLDLPDYVRFAAFAEGGDTIVLAEGDGSFVVLESGTLKERRRVATFAGEFITSFTHDPRNSRLAFGARRQVHVWSYRDFTLRTLEGERDTVGLRLNISPDGRLLGLWSAKTGLFEVRSLDDDKALFTAQVPAVGIIAFSPAGDRVVVSSGDSMGQPNARIAVFDVATGKELWTDDAQAMLGSGSATLDVSVPALGVLPGEPPIGAVITRTNDQWRDRTARVRALDDGRELGVLRGHDARVRLAALSPTGDRIATAAQDPVIRVFRRGDFDAPMLVLRGHAGWPLLRWSTSDARLLSVTVPFGDEETGTAVVWNTRAFASERHLGWLESPILAYDLGPRWLLSGHSDGSVRLWDLPSLSLRWSAPLFTAGVEHLRADAAQRFILATAEHQLRILSFAEGNPLRSIALPASEGVLGVVKHPKAALTALIVATVESDEITRQRVELLDLENGTRRPVRLREDVGDVGWLADGRRVAIVPIDLRDRTTGNQWHLLDGSDGQPVATLFKDTAHPSQFVAEGAALITKSEGTVSVTDPLTGRLLSRITVAEQIQQFAHDPRLNLLAFTDTIGKRFAVLDLTSGQVLRDVPQPPAEIWHLRFAGDRLLAGLGDGRFCEMRVAAGAADRFRPWECARLFESAQAFRSAVVGDVLPLGDFVVAQGEAGLFVWHRPTREVIEGYAGCGFFCKLYALPDGAGYLLVSTSSRRYRFDLWRVGPVGGDLLARARRLAGVLRHIDRGTR